MKPTRIKDLLPIIDELNKASPEQRREFFAIRKASRFYLWWIFHFYNNFRGDLADFHFEWINALTESEDSIMLEAFRGSLKTEIVKAYLTYCICYQLEKYIVVQSFDSSGSEDMVRNVAKMLVSQSLTTDYGQLFPLTLSKDDLAKRSISNFDCTNGVKVVSRSLGEKLRGAATYDESIGSSRPTLLVLDDIDVIDSVRNKEIIDKNEQKIENETIGSMSKERSRIIFLGNTILSDGIVRRFAAKKANAKHWKYFRQPLYDDSGKPVWDFFDDATIEKIKAQEGEEAFKQNYLLIPSRGFGSRVFKTTPKVLPPIATVGGWKFYGQPTDGIFFGVDVSEGGERGDFMAITGKKDGKTVVQYHERVNEKQLAKEMDWLLSYQVDGKKYLGAFLVESNVGRALINEMLRYEWANKLVLPFKKWSDNEWTAGDFGEYGFRTTAQSKDLLIKQYQIAISEGNQAVTQETALEMETYVWDKIGRANAMGGAHDDLIISEMLAHHASLHYPATKYDEDKKEYVHDRFREDIKRSIEAKMRQQLLEVGEEDFY